MKSRVRILAVLLLLFADTGRAVEPVIGGACEGCEYVFTGMPEQLASRARIASLEDPGVPMVIEGQVWTLDGTPAPGIIVYAYHTDAQGIYPRSSTRHGGLRGWVRTDADGRYRFDTIRPGAYPARDNPEHVHMHVIEPDRGTYYISDIVFSDDPLLTGQLRRAMLTGRGGNGLCDPVQDEAGVWQVRRDITLGLNIPGYR